jgi:hypothetical protein
MKKGIINTTTPVRKREDEKGRKENPSKQTLALTDGKPWRLTLRIPSNPKGNPEGKAGGSKVTSAQFDPIGQFKVTIRLQTGWHCYYYLMFLICIWYHD